MTDDDLKRLLEANATENRHHFDAVVDRHTAETQRLFEVATAETKRHFDISTAETRHIFETATTETKRHFDTATLETKRYFDTATLETKRYFDNATLETRRHFDISTERLEKRFDALAETVAYLDEKLDRESESIRGEMRQGFADTEAMIKFSHPEIDRRVRALEGGLSDLQSRVDRLENERAH